MIYRILAVCLAGSLFGETLVEFHGTKPDPKKLAYVIERVREAEKFTGAPSGSVKSVELYGSTNRMHKENKGLPVGEGAQYQPWMPGRKGETEGDRIWRSLVHTGEFPVDDQRCQGAANPVLGRVLVSMEANDWKHVLDHELAHVTIYYGSWSVEGLTPQESAKLEYAADHIANEMRRILKR